MTKEESIKVLLSRVASGEFPLRVVKSVMPPAGNFHILLDEKYVAVVLFPDDHTTDQVVSWFQPAAMVQRLIADITPTDTELEIIHRLAKAKEV